MRNRSLLGLALTLGMSGLAFGQADVAGKWTGTVAGRGGEQPVTLELTVTGTTVAGKLTTGQGQPVDITNAKLEGNKLTFTAPGGGGGGGGRGGGGGGAPGGGAPPAAGAPPAGGGAPEAKSTTGPITLWTVPTSSLATSGLLILFKKDAFIKYA
jgi:hypothetical protein